MHRTVRRLINELLNYPMNAKVVVSINNESDHDIVGVAQYVSKDEVYIEIEPEPSTEGRESS